MKETKRSESKSEEKICTISGSEEQVDLERIRRMVKESRYVCSSCGRSTVHAENLCSPVAL